MKALSIRQPYAWLIVAGHKPVENRTWTVTHRGPLLIHASRKMHPTPVAEIERKYAISIPRDQLQFGGIIGRVELVDIVTRSDSKWFSGPFGWILRDARPLAFHPCTGAQTLFDVHLYA
jgi:hypothetical protein